MKVHESRYPILAATLTGFSQIGIDPTGSIDATTGRVGITNQ